MEKIPALRRTFAVVLLSAALAYALVRGTDTGNWISWELACVICGGIGLDGVNRTIEKVKGAVQDAARIIQGDRPDQGS